MSESGKMVQLIKFYVCSKKKKQQQHTHYFIEIVVLLSKHKLNGAQIVSSYKMYNSKQFSEMSEPAADVHQRLLSLNNN